MPLNKKAYYILSIFCALCCFTQKAHADGFGLKLLGNGGWGYFNEQRQWALIKHENGLQKMLLSISLNAEEAGSLVWIFPVPAAPDKVKIDIADERPSIYGDTVDVAVNETLEKVRNYLFATQIYAVGLPTNLIMGAAATLGSVADRSDGINVYQRITKSGMVSELITARDGAAIYNYLQKSGFKVASGELKVLDSYAQKDFSFVVSRIEESEVNVTLEDIRLYIRKLESKSKNDWPPDVRKVWDIAQEKKAQNDAAFRHAFENRRKQPGNEPFPKRYDMMTEVVSNIQNLPDVLKDSKTYALQRTTRSRGVLVSFPTQKAFFPLLPTSVYGNKNIPLSICVLGMGSPLLFDGIKANTTTQYYAASQWVGAEEVRKYFGVGKKIDYSKINIDAPSMAFTQDLTINPGVPLKVNIQRSIINNIWGMFFILLLFSSAIAGLFAGPVVYEDLRDLKGMGKSAYVGMWNIFSIIGVYFAASIVFKKPANEQTSETLAALRDNGYFARRRFGYILLGILILIIVLTLITYIFVDPHKTSFVPALWAIVLGIFVLLSPRTGGTVPISLLLIWIFITYRCLRINKEDRPLFKKLKDAGYSVTLFKNGKSLEYTFYFSLFFLLISLILTLTTGEPTRGTL